MLPTPPPSPKPTALENPDSRLGEILSDRYQLNGILGVGAYGTVYRARDIHTGTQYAIKALNRPLGLDPRQMAFQEREIRLHYYANQHPNVVSMEQILEAPDCIYVVLEYCPEGDLFSKITEDCDYIGHDHKTRSVFLQILDAVQHCHSQGIYHRDLKPENILVKDNGWTVKLADFGLATQDSRTADFGCGSTFYMSPECQQSNPPPYACYASESNDIWSLGVILVNLVCGRNPWKRASLSDSTFRAFVRDRNFLQSILPISSAVNNILQRIFEVNPKHRVSLDELRQLITSCQHFSAETEDQSLPPTPEYSPVQKPVDSPLAYYGTGLEAVPNMDPLPGQEYPAFTSPPQLYTPRSAPIDIPTPPGPSQPSPRHSPYTYPVKPVLTTFTGPPAAPSHPWLRCANFVPNLASQMCWRSPLVI